MATTCDMIVSHLCNEHGEPGQEIECGKPLWLVSVNGGGYCREHADEAYADGLDSFIAEDAALYVEQRAAEIPKCTADTCTGQNCESCRWRHAAHEMREWLAARGTQ